MTLVERLADETDRRETLERHLRIQSWSVAGPPRTAAWPARNHRTGSACVPPGRGFHTARGKRKEI